MTAKSISFCQGKGSLSHNNREFVAKNVDSNRTKDNVTFISEPIAEAYQKCFGGATERYNARQKRKDRQIGDYYENTFKHKICNTVITASDKRKSFYEDIVQIGTMQDSGVGSGTPLTLETRPFLKTVKFSSSGLLRFSHVRMHTSSSSFRHCPAFSITFSDNAY
ncbi:MAG: hypothetical protein IKP69_12200 [Oscillospiraceae bacterium]|nr:hypothetical protein [Oscillospiraceae bacterium]